MSKFPDRRLRFSVEQDMQLLLQVLNQNPFEDIDRWTEVHENFVQDCNVPFSLRTCKDHVNHLLGLHLKGALKMLVVPHLFGIQLIKPISGVLEKHQKILHKKKKHLTRFQK